MSEKKKTDPALERRAALLWPGDERNQREWIRAVGVVRSTTRGWVMDHRAQRAAR